MKQPAPVFVVPTFLLGLLFAFAFPPYGWAWAGFVALCGLCLCIRHAPTGKTAFWGGYAFGAGQFLVNFFWIANAFSVREGFSYAQGIAAVVALALAVALYPGFISLLAHRISHKAVRPYAFPFAFAGAWVLGEWVRGFLFTGFPWNPVGAIWGGVLPAAQLASLVGVYGLGGVTVLVAGLLMAMFDRGWLPARLSASLAGLAIGIAVFLFGLRGLPNAPLAVFDDLDLVLVQANIPQSEKWDSTLLAEHMAAHIDLSNPAGDLNTRRVVIWPETAYPYLIERYKGAQKELQAALGDKATVLFGANRFVGEGKSRSARNALFILQKGALVDRYDKVHLVPFGEYVPLAPVLSLLGIQSLVDALEGFSKGPRVHLLQAEGVPPFAPMICYEGIFPDHLSGLDTRPDWILNISNDAWFGDSSGPPQHLNLVRFRAIEQGVSLVRSTGTGITAVIDAYGRDVARLPSFKAAALTTKLPKGLAQTPLFARFGGKMTLILCLFFLTIGVLCSRSNYA